MSVALTMPTPLLGCHNLRLTDVEAANDAWTFNCGPAALCAITGLSPEQLRPFMGDFESRGYTNPTLMRETLTRLGLRFRWGVMAEQSAAQITKAQLPRFGLARIQWGGPWCNPGVPMQARYRQTHWVATARSCGSRGVFDVNNNTGDNEVGWTPFEDWARVVVPAIIATYKRADGMWWVTHSVEVSRG